jgi:hypothetical protein
LKKTAPQKQEKPGLAKRRSVGQRVGDGARLIRETGDDLLNRPGVLPGKAHGWFRTWFAKIWRVRGGGLYAVGYALTFAYLEVRSIISEIMEAEGVVDFFTGQIIEFFIRFISDSVLNMVQAFMWPLWLIQAWQPFGAIALCLLFIAFPLVLKKPLEHWLFGDEAAKMDPPGE